MAHQQAANGVLLEIRSLLVVDSPREKNVYFPNSMRSILTIMMLCITQNLEYTLLVVVSVILSARMDTMSTYIRLRICMPPSTYVCMHVCMHVRICVHDDYCFYYREDVLNTTHTYVHTYSGP